MSHVAAVVNEAPEPFARRRGPGAGAVRPPPGPAAADVLNPITAATVNGLRRLPVLIGSQVVWALASASTADLVTSPALSKRLWPNG